ncbi:TPA: hypothetical protein R8G83_003060 [Citrobacter youngae]|nr:hypothetical protein [Citrobacter youngae]HEF0091412.1 hypothetical protein [Citrobacter youngae]
MEKCHPGIVFTVQISHQQTRKYTFVDFNGRAELWWKDLESHLAIRKTEEGLSALREFLMLKADLWI